MRGLLLVERLRSFYPLLSWILWNLWRRHRLRHKLRMPTKQPNTDTQHISVVTPILKRTWFLADKRMSSYRLNIVVRQLSGACLDRRLEAFECNYIAVNGLAFSLHNKTNMSIRRLAVTNNCKRPQTYCEPRIVVGSRFPNIGCNFGFFGVAILENLEQLQKSVWTLPLWLEGFP